MPLVLAFGVIGLLPVGGKRSTTGYFFHGNDMRSAFFSTIVVVASAFTEVNPIIMPRGVLKENLPTKVCIICDRPFTWRKKWERVWDEVTTCSKSCNHKRKSSNRSGDSDRRDKNNNANANDQVEFGDDSLDLLGSVMGLRIATAGADSGETIAEGEGERESNIQYQDVEEENEEDENVDDYDDSKSQTGSISIDHDSTTPTPLLEHFDAKAQRKAEKKRKKAERRAQKMGQGDPTAGQKRCTLCDNSVNLLIRCTYDSSGEWVSRTNAMNRRTIKLIWH